MPAWKPTTRGQDYSFVNKSAFLVSPGLFGLFLRTTRGRIGVWVKGGRWWNLGKEEVGENTLTLKGGNENARRHHPGSVVSDCS